MATPLANIYNRIIAYKQGVAAIGALDPTYNLAPPNLTPYQRIMNDISTNSPVGRWRLQAYVFAAVAYIQEVLYDGLIARIVAILAVNKFGTLPWYVATVKQFQYGFALNVYAQYSYGYSDTTSAAAIASRIVAQCSATPVQSIAGIGILIKVAKSVGGVLQPLSNAEQIAVTSYLHDVKPPGDETTVININPDVVKENTVIYYDGTLDLPTFKLAIAAARTNLFVNGIDFNGRLYLNGINDKGTPQPGWVDTYNSVPGCLGAQVNSLQARPYISGIWTNVLFNYLADSGYYVYDDANSNIQYIPQ